MFGLFKKVIIDDPVLGPLRRRGRDWHGAINLLDGQEVPLELEGTKHAPYTEVLSCAHKVQSRIHGMIPEISTALFEHLKPYQEALSDPDRRDEYLDLLENRAVVRRIEKIGSAEQAWAETQISGVEIGSVDGKIRLLIKIDTLWDEEHSVGAYFDDWRFMELNGSV